MWAYRHNGVTGICACWRVGATVGGKPDSVRRLPMRVNLRAGDLDCAGPLVLRENQSRRDLTKVAQYEVLGNEVKGKSVP